MRQGLRAVSAALLLAGMAGMAGTSLACGYCVEDRIAAVYDHAVITTAAAHRHQVAFFAVDGPMPAEAAARARLQRALAASRGADAGTLRFSFDGAAVSVAFDPRRANLAVVQRDIERRLGPYRLTLLPLRVMDGPAEVKVAGER